MPFVLFGLALAIGLGAAWYRRRDLARNVFERASTELTARLSQLDLVSSLPDPVWTYDAPPLAAHVLGVDLGAPAVTFGPAPSGIAFDIQTTGLTVNFAVTTSTLGVTIPGTATVQALDVPGTITLSPDATAAAATADNVTLIGFGVQIDPTSVAAAILSGMLVQTFQAELHDKLVTAIRGAIETQVPPLLTEYLVKYPTAAQALLAVSNAAQSG